MRPIRRMAMLAAAMAASASLALAAGTASAATASKSHEGPYKLTATMHLVGVNTAVAKAHGYRFAKIHGRYYYQKLGSAGPMDVVSGNCGSSYMWLYADGSERTTASTGFNVVAAAVSYSWNIVVVDNAGTQHHSWGGGLAFDSSWAGSYTSHHSVKGYAWAEVVSGHALLWDGEICSSLYPWDWTDIY